jgi:hypothetical protein
VPSVCLALQAQQALQKAAWPPELLPSEVAPPPTSTLPRRPFSFLRTTLGGSGGEVRSFTTLGPAGFSSGEGGTGDTAGAQRSAFSEAEIAPAPAGVGGGCRLDVAGERPASAAAGLGASRRSIRAGSAWLHGSSARGNSSSRRSVPAASPGHVALLVQDSIPDSSIGSYGTSLSNGEAGCGHTQHAPASLCMVMEPGRGHITGIEWVRVHVGSSGPLPCGCCLVCSRQDLSL